MRRAQLLASEILALLVVWALWDWRIALTLFVLLLVAGAFVEAYSGPRRAESGIPTLRSPLERRDPSAAP